MKKIVTIVFLTLIACSTVLADSTAFVSDLPVNTSVQEGLMVWKTPGDQFSLWIDGRLFLDYAYYNEAVPAKLDLASGSEVSRFRLSFKSTHYKHWLTEMDLSFGENAVEIKDAWIAWKGDKLLLKVGNFKEPFGLENMTSSRYENFIEASYLDMIPYGRAMGVGASYSYNGWQGSAGVFQQVAGDVDAKVGLKGLKDNDEAYAVTARTSANVLEYFNLPAVLHLGVSGSYRTPSASTNTFLWEGRAETRISKIKFFNASVIEADHKTDLGLEAAAQYKRFTTSAEYQRSVVTREESSHYKDVLVDGGYVAANVFLTNDQQQYSSSEGEFGKVVPKKKYGAIQLLGRYSFVDLNEGGAGSNYTAGLTWHINTNHRVQLQYSRADLDANANAKGMLKSLNSSELDFDTYTIRFIALL